MADHRSIRVQRQNMNPIISSKADPEQKPPGDHWQRFRRLMALMTVLAFATAGFTVWRMRVDGVPFHLHFVIALGGGIIISLLLAGALMGLAFVSNRSGHDDVVAVVEEPDD
jgi:hypothetical protein